MVPMKRGEWGHKLNTLFDKIYYISVRNQAVKRNRDMYMVGPWSKMWTDLVYQGKIQVKVLKFELFKLPLFLVSKLTSYTQSELLADIKKKQA